MSQQHILQVSELTKKVRFILENELNTVWLTGEISNFISAGSGHWYLSLKDDKSQVKCAMFKGSNRRVRVKPTNGQQVLVRAKVSLYEPRGDFQLIIEQMEDAGEGILRQKYQQLKNRLSALGIFDLQYKKTIPQHINCVGLVTSPTGAAVNDILSVLKRRNPHIKAIIYPALVQGELAQATICKALKTANSRKECDAIILSRGGGSLEDLWPFNEESVVSAIHQSIIPVISAVGHEIDTTLSDYAADLRAATPSAAAELISIDSEDLSQQIRQLQRRLHQSLQKKIQGANIQCNHIKHRLEQVHPEQQLHMQQQKSDELNLRLSKAIRHKLQQSSYQPAQLKHRLEHTSPIKEIIRNQQEITKKTQRLSLAIDNMFQHKNKLFINQIEQLHLVSPLATLARGYSIIRDTDNQLISSVKQVSSTKELKLQVKDGVIKARVI